MKHQRWSVTFRSDGLAVLKYRIRQAYNHHVSKRYSWIVLRTIWPSLWILNILQIWHTLPRFWNACTKESPHFRNRHQGNSYVFQKIIEFLRISLVWFNFKLNMRNGPKFEKWLVPRLRRYNSSPKRRYTFIRPQRANFNEYVIFFYNALLNCVSKTLKIILLKKKIAITEENEKWLNPLEDKACPWRNEVWLSKFSNFISCNACLIDFASP